MSFNSPIVTQAPVVVVTQYDKFIRKPIQWDDTQNIKFQIVSWYDTDCGHLDPEKMGEAMEDYHSNISDPNVEFC